MSESSDKTTRWPKGMAFWPSYIAFRLGLWLMPEGRAKSELTALLWTWNLEIQATVAAHRLKLGGYDV